MSFLYNNFIADVFLKLLEFVYNNVVSNYVAVVLLVLIVLKVILTPLELKQRESSMKMMKIQHKVEDIKKRYTDPMAQSKKLQELYARENIKMTAGCLPTLAQFVILIAFFGALQHLAYNQIVMQVAEAAKTGEAIELTGFLWVRNIWQADSGSALVMPTLKQWEQILKTVTPEVAALVQGIDYEAVIQPTLTAYSGYSNGWYILPIVQGVTMYFAMGYSMNATVANPQDNPMSGPMMKLMMAGMTTWFCLSANTLFTMYWIFTNLFMFIQTFLFKKYFEYKDKKQEENK